MATMTYNVAVKGQDHQPLAAPSSFTVVDGNDIIAALITYLQGIGVTYAGPQGELSVTVENADSFASPGAVATAAAGSAWGTVPTVTGLSAVFRESGDFCRIDFTFTAMEITVTDAGAGGASGSVKILDFAQMGLMLLGSVQIYTAFAEGAALTGGAGDAAFVMGLGSVAANAGDAALTGTEVDFGDVTSTITLSGGTGTGNKLTGPKTTPLDGHTTAVDLYLNWSGSAATIDANSTIAVTGKASVLVARTQDF